MVERKVVCGSSSYPAEVWELRRLGDDAHSPAASGLHVREAGWGLGGKEEPKAGCAGQTEATV